MLPVFCLIFKYFYISFNTFLAAKTDQNEKKMAPSSVVCHGVPENAFQVNQLYNVTWSSNHVDYTGFLNMYLISGIKKFSSFTKKNFDTYR